MLTCGSILFFDTYSETLYLSIMNNDARTRRLQIFVSERVYNSVKKLSALNNESLSRTLGDLFEAILPGIDRTNNLLETAQRLQDEAKTSFLESMNKYENDLSLTVNNHMDVVDSEVRQYKLPIE
jgi:hypothetical protein